MYSLPRPKAWFMIMVLGITAYVPTLRMGFLWDDHVVIESNPRIREWSLQNLKKDFTSDIFDHQGDPYFRPMTSVINRIDYSLWGMRAMGYHLTNLFFHLGNAVLSSELALVLGMSPLAAFIVGSLFAVHPIAVEQLMIVAGRAELMVFFFSMAAILLLVRPGRHSLVWGWLAYLLALLSKENAVMVPFLLSLVLYARQEPRKTYTRGAALCLAWIPYLWLRHRAVGPMLPQTDLWLTIRFFTQEFPHVVFRYLAILMIPWNLHSHRLLPHLNHFWPATLALLLSGCVFLIRRYKRLAAFCVLWFVLTLLPRTPVMIFGNFMLDHWVYPATLSVIIPFAWLVSHVWESQQKHRLALVGALYFVVLIVWALFVHLNVALRGTDEKMYRWALHFTTSNPIHYNLGILLLQSGRAQEAIPHLAIVCGYYPENPDNAHALALAYAQAGHVGAACQILEGLREAHPSYQPAVQSLRAAKALLQSKKK